MFTRLLHLSRNLLTNSYISQQSQSIVVPENDPSFEPKRRETEDQGTGMVTTRRQSHSFENDKKRAEVKKAIVNGGAEKRKSSRETKIVNGGKRRKVEGEKTDDSIEDEDGHGEVSPADKAEDDTADQENITVKSSGAEVDGDADSSPRDPAGMETVCQTSNSSQPAQAQSKSKKKRQSKKNVVRENKNEASLPNGHTNLSSTKRQHVRFGSEEPQRLSMINQGPASQNTESIGTIQNGTANSDDSGSDDAPETMQNMSGLERLQAESMKAAQARESEKQLLRRKHQEQHAKLKDQAAAKKRTKKAPIDSDDEGKNDEEPSAITVDPEFQLPDLLPEHILNAVPHKQRFDQPLEPCKSQKQQITHSAKIPKDVSIGKTTIRVSQPTTHPFSLPPKSSKSSKNVRESWLASLRGVTTGGTRRTPTKFTRK